MNDEETIDSGEEFEMPSEYPHEGKVFEETNTTYLKGIGKGGMGAVYLGQRGEEKVILKHILWDGVSRKNTKNAAARFNLEGKILEQLSHEYGIECIPKAIYIPDPKRIEAREDLPIIMEYAGDLNLKKLSEQEGKLEEKIRIAELGGLGFGEIQEKANIVHRDIKPENINCNIEGDIWIKILDYGIGKDLEGDSNITQTGDILGTPPYMPKEMMVGKPVTVLSDQYSYGKTLHHLFTGECPHTGRALEVMGKVIGGEVPAPLIELNPLIPRKLSDAVQKLMADNPKDRFDSFYEFAAEIKDSHVEDSTKVISIPEKPTSTTDPTQYVPGPGEDPDKTEILNHIDTDATLEMTQEERERIAFEERQTISDSSVFPPFPEINEDSEDDNNSQDSSQQ